MSAFYAEDLAAIHAEAFETLAASATMTLLPHLPPAAASGRLLDIGCGAGPLIQRLAARGYRVWGLDISPALIRRAQERTPNAELICGSVLDVDLPAGSAAVAIGEVLNYATVNEAHALTRVFRNVFDALEPGGVFLFDLASPGRGGNGRVFSEGGDWAVGMVATELDGRLIRRIATFRKVENGAWRRSDEEHHLRLWPVREVTERLVSVGFEAERLDGYHGASLPPAMHVYLARKPS